MQKFLEKRATTLRGKALNIVIAFLVCLIWVAGVTWFLNWLQTDTMLGVSLTPETKQQVFFACIMAPLWEELYYRYIPIKIANHLPKSLLVPIILFTSMAFGLAHGQGIYSILIQGVMGLVFSMLYIKNGNSYWSSVILHAAWNAFIIFIVGS